MVKVKICGITNLEDAQASIGAGCDALGFVFFKKSPRYITPVRASKIIKSLPADSIKIGVFVDAREKTILRLAKLCHLNMIQLHGNESPEFCRRLKDYKVIKAFRLKDKIDFKKISQYNTFAYLFDTFAKSKVGGTGKRFNWELLRYLDNVKQLIFLAGGLNPKNVLQAMKIARPDWVDASSELEVTPGKKDHKKVKRFIAQVRKAG